MILVLGATGTTGGEVARQLIATGERPRLLVRTPQKAAAFREGADLVQGDLDDRASLERAMRDVGHVYLVSAGADLVMLERNVVDAAKAAGVHHVVKLSVLGADTPGITFARWHHESEQHLMGSGLEWTMLRPGSFMSNALGWADTIRSQGAFYQPTGTGRWAAIDPMDIGAMAVRALTEAGHAGKSYAMTGPESMDAAGYAAVLGKALNKPVAFVDVPPSAAEQAMLGSGLPPVYVNALLDLMAMMKAGHADAVIDDSVKRVLGRPAGSFESWVGRNMTAFA